MVNTTYKEIHWSLKIGNKRKIEYFKIKLFFILFISTFVFNSSLISQTVITIQDSLIISFKYKQMRRAIHKDGYSRLQVQQIKESFSNLGSNDTLRIGGINNAIVDSISIVFLEQTIKVKFENGFPFLLKNKKVKIILDGYRIKYKVTKNKEFQRTQSLTIHNKKTDHIIYNYIIFRKYF